MALPAATMEKTEKGDKDTNLGRNITEETTITDTIGRDTTRALQEKTLVDQFHRLTIMSILL